MNNLAIHQSLYNRKRFSHDISSNLLHDDYLYDKKRKILIDEFKNISINNPDRHIDRSIVNNNMNGYLITNNNFKDTNQIVEANEMLDNEDKDDKPIDFTNHHVDKNIKVLLGKHSLYENKVDSLVDDLIRKSRRLTIESMTNNQSIDIDDFIPQNNWPLIVYNPPTNLLSMHNNKSNQISNNHQTARLAGVLSHSDCFINDDTENNMNIDDNDMDL
mmetsp:Transcript_20817/g.18969  ORF Transcript_20817/g.18969 Transcript_20817/m.18969 type:complete len:217 (-) Transcript_20817:1038-1688(-)